MLLASRLSEITKLLLIFILHCAAQSGYDGQFYGTGQLQQQASSSYGDTSYSSSASSHLPAVCRGRTGYVADILRNCQVFFNCLPDGTVTTSTCPGNYQFDESTQCCKMPHEVNCAGLLDGAPPSQNMISCTGKRGFFADETSMCRSFIFCEPSGRSRRLNCPEGLLFNEQIGCCDVAQSVPCGNQSPQSSTLSSQMPSSAANAFCSTRPPGFFANPSDCSTYFFCQSGRGHFLRCPSSQAFNELTSSCDDDLSRCYGVRVDSTIFDCTGQNGWYQQSGANDPNCQRSFYCNAGATYLHTCPGNLRWNSASLSCESPDRVPCGTSPQPPVIFKPPITAVTSGPAPGPPSDSYGNYNNYGVMTQSPINSVDAITTQLPWNSIGETYPSVNVVSTQAGFAGGPTTFYSSANSNPGLGIDNNYDCRGKIGYYAIIETGCSQFIYCNPEGIPHRFECPTTLQFNNSLAVCDWPQNVRCRNQVVPDFLPNTINPPSFDCRGKDGFYADQNRGARIFFLCHADGVKFQYVCPSNLVFNEQTAVCDWPDYMRQEGFTQRPQSEITQYVSVDWNNQPLDCRVRPAGFYANPNNNQAYARCTFDGTFVPMRCPQGTIFDPVLGQCVFPFQIGIQGQTSSTTQNPGSQNGNSGYFTGSYGSGNNAYFGTFSGVYHSTRPQITTQSSYGPAQTPNDQTNPGFQNGLNGNGIQYGVSGNTGGYGTLGVGNPHLSTSAPNIQIQSNRPFGVNQYGNNDNGNNYASGNAGGYDTQGLTTSLPDIQTNMPINQYGNNDNGIHYAVSGDAGGYGNSGLGNANPATFGPIVTDMPFYPQQLVTTQRAPQTSYYYPPNNPGPDYPNQGTQSNSNNVGNNQNGYGVYPTQTMYGSSYYGNSQIQPPVPLSLGGQQVPRPGISVDVTYNGGNQGVTSRPLGPNSRQIPTLCIGRSGMFADRTSGCSWYAVCGEDGNGEMRMCSRNLLFNERLGVCDDPQNVNCYSDVPGIVQPRVPICLTGNAANTFVPDVTQSCTTFYSCEQNGQGTGFRCPTGMQFNPKINACDDPRNCNCAAGNGGTINVRIPVTKTVLDTYDPNGYAADYVASNADQSMELEIPLSSPQTGERLPLVRGYDSLLYSDTNGAHGRLPSFYTDDYQNMNLNFSEHKSLSSASVEDDSTARKYIAPESPVSMLPVINLKATADSMKTKKSWLRDSRQRSYYRPQNKSLDNVFHRMRNNHLLLQNLKGFR